LEYEFSFSTWEEYNSLLKSIKFYEKIIQFKFLLIVQTDAFVFSNRLIDFCKYDYVGAPWKRDSFKFINGRVGNGGFSLRNVNKICYVLKSKKRMFSFVSLLHLNFKHEYKFGSMIRKNGFKRFTLLQIFKLFSLSMYQYLFINTFRKSFCLESLMEDSLFGVLTPYHFNSFIVPEVETAVQFSIDENPELFFQHNDGRLPIGCHAFVKNYNNFWNKYILQDSNK
jgi:hypothetical protein